MQGVSESLAGRTAVLRLHSMGLREVVEDDSGPTEPEERLLQLSEQAAVRELTGRDHLARRIFRGGYPEVALREDLDADRWFGSYVQTYLERDVRSLRAVGALADFDRFLVAVAARTGGLWNSAEVARDVGVSRPTIQAWLSVLEASGQTARLTPWFGNLGKRLVKSPKVYWLDTGLLGYLLRLREPADVFEGPAAGAVFEAAVFGALLRLFDHAGRVPRIHFLRTSAGLEVDFLVEVGRGDLVAIEAKATSSPKPAHGRAIERVAALFGGRVVRGYVVCAVEAPVQLSHLVHAVPLGAL